MDDKKEFVLRKEIYKVVRSMDTHQLVFYFVTDKIAAMRPELLEKTLGLLEAIKVTK